MQNFNISAFFSSFFKISETRKQGFGDFGNAPRVKLTKGWFLQMLLHLCSNFDWFVLIPKFCPNFKTVKPDENVETLLRTRLCRSYLVFTRARHFHQSSLVHNHKKKHLEIKIITEKSKILTRNTKIPCDFIVECAGCFF